MFDHHKINSFFKTIEAEKRAEIEIGKTPFERSEGPWKIFAWRMAAIIMMAGLSVSLYLVSKVVNSVYKKNDLMDFYILGPLSLAAMLLTILGAGRLCFEIILRRNPSYEFAVLMKPLVIFFLGMSLVMGGIAFGLFFHKH